jgi:hypothetical protein
MEYPKIISAFQTNKVFLTEKTVFKFIEIFLSDS